MSEWAYRKCSKCDARVHVNYTCKTWGNKENNCEGDPWGVRDKLWSEIDAINKDLINHEKEIIRLEKIRDEKVEKLSKI